MDNSEREYEWSGRDIPLPQGLALVRAFVDMLLLASGYQPLTGSPARWRELDIKRALGWASLLEEVMKGISGKMEESKQAFEIAFHDMMVSDKFPEGLPRLSCETLSNAKQLLISAMSNSIGLTSEHAESLVAAIYGKEEDWDLVMKTMFDRFQAEDYTNSLLKAVFLAAPILNSRKSVSNVHCCQDWREKSLSYMLDGETLYKLSGAIVLFQSSEPQWRSALQISTSIAHNEQALLGICELCCLQLTCNKWSTIISKLMGPCENLSCSRQCLMLEHMRKQTTMQVQLDAGTRIEAFLQELLERDDTMWWNLPSIIIASALTKGSTLLYNYTRRITELMQERCCKGACKLSSDEICERIWCLQFQGLYNL